MHARNLRHDGEVDGAELIAAVESAFERTGQGFTPWPDPHPDRMAREEEYSRLIDPGKWRIVGARADAWLAALVDAGIATLEQDATIRWQDDHRFEITRTDLVIPRAGGALALVVARSRIGGVDGAGVVLGVGDPTVCVAWFPDCGCDACDSGSQNELDHFDQYLLAIVTGTFRRLDDGAGREIIVLDQRLIGWRSSGSFGRHAVESVIANPAGWTELSGVSWLVQEAT